jgi:predicted pyridoxine 5'-phosphate oxidase superfamily flavin-nucleotide-binding protein
LVQPNLGAAVDGRHEASMTEERSPFHDGEQMVQTKVGVRDQMERRGRAVIRSFMPDQHREFFASQPFLVLSSADREGQPWASMVFGAPGFMTSDEPDLLKVEAWPASDDPLLYGLHNGASVGGLGIELPSRRRNRVNGRIEECRNDIGFTLRVRQSFGNCPRYIQVRAPQPRLNPDRPQPIQSNDHLVKADIDLIAAADTFFIASRSADLDGSRSNGLDVSHRGGLPGFVQVVSDHELCFPDYKGNLLFNTLGNLLVDPRRSPLRGFQGRHDVAAYRTGTGCLGRARGDGSLRRRTADILQSRLCDASRKGLSVRIRLPRILATSERNQSQSTIIQTGKNAERRAF